jgi:hypothetical protein
MTRILVVQSGPPELLTQAVDAVRAAHPEAELTVLLQREKSEDVPRRAGVEYLVNEGSKRAMVAGLRARRFEAAYALQMGDPDYWKLELVPFLVGAGSSYAVDEQLGCFRTPPIYGFALLRHVGSGSAGFGEAAALACRALVYPAVLARLAAYELWTNFRRGARWKWPM